MYKKTFLVAFAITALNFILTWYVSSNWDISSMEDMFISKEILANHWQLPLVSLILILAGWCAQYIDPHRKGLLDSKAIVYFSIIGLAVMALIAQQGFILLEANIISERIFDGAIITTLYVTLFGISNYLSTARKSYLTGLPTPWTMKSDLSWAKTHRFLGRSMMLVAIVSLITTIAKNFSTGAIIIWYGVIAANIAAIIYSYIVWKGDPARNKS